MPFTDLFDITARVRADGTTESIELRVPAGTLQVTRGAETITVEGTFNGKEIKEDYAVGPDDVLAYKT